MVIILFERWPSIMSTPEQLEDQLQFLSFRLGTLKIERVFSTISKIARQKFLFMMISGNGKFLLILSIVYDFMLNQKLSKIDEIGSTVLFRAKMHGFRKLAKFTNNRQTSLELKAQRYKQRSYSVAILGRSYGSDTRDKVTKTMLQKNQKKKQLHSEIEELKAKIFRVQCTFNQQLIMRHEKHRIRGQLSPQKKTISTKSFQISPQTPNHKNWYGKRYL